MRIFGLEIKVSKVRNKDELGKMPATIPSWMDESKYITASQDMASLLNAYRSWVYVCANKNATTFAQQKLRLYVTKQSSSEKVIVRTKAISKEMLDYIYRSPVSTLNCVRKAVEIEEVTEHPLLDMFKNVNQYMNRFELLEMIDLYQELTGNAYLYVVKNSIGVPAALWLLPPDRVTIVPSKKEWIAFQFPHHRDLGCSIHKNSIC